LLKLEKKGKLIGKLNIHLFKFFWKIVTKHY